MASRLRGYWSTVGGIARKFFYGGVQHVMSDFEESADADVF